MTGRVQGRQACLCRPGFQDSEDPCSPKEPAEADALRSFQGPLYQPSPVASGGQIVCRPQLWGRPPLHLRSQGNLASWVQWDNQLATDPGGTLIYLQAFFRVCPSTWRLGGRIYSKRICCQEPWDILRKLLPVPLPLALSYFGCTLCQDQAWLFLRPTAQLWAWL